MTKKYRQVYDISRVNELYEEGYRLHTVATETFQEDNTARMITRPFYLMSLQEPNKYENIDKYKSFQITREEQTLPEGWQILHHTSKELIGVTKHEGDKLRNALRDWLACDGELDSVISIVEDYC